MKKILCFTIALIMLLGAVSVSAVTEEGNIYSNEFYQPRFQECCDRLSPNGPEMGFNTYKELYVHYTNEATRDYIIVEPSPDYAGEPAIFLRIIGDYVFFDYQYTYPMAPRIYVYVSSTDEVLHIREAYEKYPEEMVPGLNAMTQEKYVRVGLRGDVDFNGELNIKDVTLLQKKIAGLDKVYNNYLNGELYHYVIDMNLDYIINIKDATAIQKYIAGLEY